MSNPQLTNNKLNAIWDEIRKVPGAIDKALVQIGEEQAKIEKARIQVSKDQNQLLKDIKNLDQTALAEMLKESTEQIVKDYITNAELSVKGDFYQEIQRIAGEVSIKEEDTTYIATRLAEAIVSGIKIPEAKEVVFPDVFTVRQESAFEIFGKVAVATMPPDEYMSVRLTDGKEFVDFSKKIDELKEALEQNTGAVGVVGGGGSGVQDSLIENDAVKVTGTINATPSTLADYSVNDISVNKVYYGLTKPDATWLILKKTDTLISYATVLNNPSVLTYNNAWDNNTTLTYGRFDEAF